MIVYSLENDIVTAGSIPREKFINSFGDDIEIRFVDKIEDISSIDIGVIYVSSLQNLGETKQDIMDSLYLISDKDIRIIIGDIPETLEIHPDITKVVTALYRILAYKDYKKRVVNQQQKINEMKQDSEQWKSYGRNKKLTMEEFASVYESILRGELSIKDGQQKLSISKRTYYIYKELYENKYTNT